MTEVFWVKSDTGYCSMAYDFGMFVITSNGKNSSKLQLKLPDEGGTIDLGDYDLPARSVKAEADYYHMLLTAVYDIGVKHGRDSMGGFFR